MTLVDISKGHILIVDDEPINIRLLSFMLTRKGYHVRTVMNGPMAIQSIQDQAPDVILLDINMPGMNGYEVCQHLKLHKHTCDIPVIFISALDNIDNKMRAFEYGGVDYITKPFRVEEVLARVATHVTIQTMQKQLQDKNDLLQQEISTRRQAQHALRRAHQELEQRVIQRTAELTQTNINLQAEIYERTRQQNQNEAIIAAAAALRTATTFTETITTLLEQMTTLLTTQGIVLLLYPPKNDHIIIEQGKGIWHTIAQQAIAIDEYTKHLFAQKEPLHIQGASHDPITQTLHLHSVVQHITYIPLIAEHQPIGALGIGTENSLPNQDIRILTVISDIAASALYRARLHEQTQRRLEHIQALHTIDQTITTSLNLRITLNVLIYQVTTQLNIHAAAVLLFNTDTQRLEYSTSYGFHTSAISQTSLALGEGLAGRVAIGQEFLHIPDIRQTDIPFVRTSMFQTEAFVSYYGVPLIARGRIKGVIELFHRTPFQPDNEWLDFLSTLAGQASIAIDNGEMFAQLQHSNKELSQAYDATIEGWARALELRDKETEGHSRRVTDLIVRLAHQFGISDTDIVHIRRGAILHDIGKMGIPDAILLKEGPLTPDEQAIMQQHTIYAYNLLEPIPFLRAALDIPYCHHEKWDGTGYPRGLQGETIPLAARLFSVVDVWDALSSDRPYRKAWDKKRITHYLHQQTGTHFDPHVVKAFICMMEL